MKLTPKMLAAREALKRRTKMRAPDPESGDECAAKLDRFQGYCQRNPTAALMGLPGFRSVKNQRIKRSADRSFQPFGRAHWFWSKTSNMKISLESERREAWLPPYRVTLYADDNTGLLPGEVFGVLEALPDFRMTLLEVAFDFSPALIDRKTVRKHGLFGKSRPAPSVGSTDYWGTRKGVKRVQSYLKETDEDVSS